MKPIVLIAIVEIILIGVMGIYIFFDYEADLERNEKIFLNEYKREVLRQYILQEFIDLYDKIGDSNEKIRELETYGKDFIEAMKIIENVATQHEYVNKTEALEKNISEYTCLNFSHDARVALTEQGFDARMICGWKNSTVGHTGLELRLYPSPQTLEVAKQPLEDYPKNQYYCEDKYFGEQK